MGGSVASRPRAAAHRHAPHEQPRSVIDGLHHKARPSTERGVGDVFISWEYEAFLASKEMGPDKFQIVVPSSSILAEPLGSVVDKNVDRKGTREVATAYLQYWYSPEGQEIAAQNCCRPIGPQGAAKYDKKVPKSFFA